MAPPSSWNLAALPIMALKDRIVEKINSNRVTLIVGDTGCGKSSQIPQFLLQAGLQPILCTQPRRFAVVAVAKMVAEARSCQVGDEVGYHIGQLKRTNPWSKIVFKTAGVLMEEMREKGIAALKTYKVIILDEVHERSVESDLVLVCVKQFMLKHNELRVVLMSATADITRYRDYFKDLGRDERVDVLAIPSTSKETIFQRKVLYLEQVTELLEVKSDFLSALEADTISSSSVADITPQFHNLIRDLVLYIHKTEPDIEKSILIFLPTYRSLEQQWSLLAESELHFKVHILHSSIDTEQALMAMQICKSDRKVILATNIAESSVTIPGVAFVIDSCRSLQIFWDDNRKRDATELVWVSKSQADQRKGRTGRTCDGQIYRLVPRTLFNSFVQHEIPAILKLSLRKQVITISCAESKIIYDPRALLRKALDPPNPEIVRDALNLLVHLHALDAPTSHRGRYEPTFVGHLLGGLPLNFDASMLVIKFGEIGMLREGILLGILMDSQPLPIHHPFGQHKLDKDRLEQLKQEAAVNGEKSILVLNPSLEKEWCSSHNLVQRSLHAIGETYDVLLHAMHRFRPNFLVGSHVLPNYYTPNELRHNCLLHQGDSEDDNYIGAGTSLLEVNMQTNVCIDSPFVTPRDFQASSVAANLRSVIKEIRVLCTEDVSENQHGQEKLVNDPFVCRFFLNGSCDRGSQCQFLHFLHEMKPPCRYFFSLEGCRYGASCRFSHSIPGFDGSLMGVPCAPEIASHEPYQLLPLWTTKLGYFVLILDDGELNFTSRLSQYFQTSNIVVATEQQFPTIPEGIPMGITILEGVDFPMAFISMNAKKVPIIWRKVQSVLWCVKFMENNEDFESQSGLLEKLFKCLAIRCLADGLHDMQLILIMNNLRFSQLQVERLGQDCFFFLMESIPFDEATFGEFLDCSMTRQKMVACMPVIYIFKLHPPSKTLFGDYTSTLRNNLYYGQSHA
ncbi:hypothetical protein AMTRI_Chr02g222720 [Amborella trichopoda]